MSAPPSAPLAQLRTGRGAPLLLLHPLGADRHVWDPVIPLLAGRREVIAVDLPGFGESPRMTAGTPTPRALAAAVVEHLASIGVARPHVAGNSLGGWVALELGLSGAAASVTGIAPAGLWPEPLVPKAALGHRLARALLPVAGRSAATRPGRSLLLSSAVAHPRRVPPAAARRLVEAYGTASDFVAVNAAMRAGRFDGLERIRCPVTFVWPDHDRLIRRPVWVPDRIRNVVLSDAGHVPMWDAPEALARILLDATGGANADPATLSLLQEELAGEAS
jgi:pimeloyl-ACP methyl ester carboxylesterase